MYLKISLFFWTVFFDIIVLFIRSFEKSVGAHCMLGIILGIGNSVRNRRDTVPVLSET